jgi:hypothetical protein
MQDAYRLVRHPLTNSMLAPLPPDCQCLQFDTALTQSDYQVLAQLIDGRPDICLRAFSDIYETLPDLSFLRFFPEIKRFRFDLFELCNWDGLQYLPDELEYLGIGQTRSRANSLRFIARFKQLKSLSLEGQTKHLEAILACEQLENVTLRMMTLPNLSILSSHKKLLSLRMHLGGTRNLRPIESLGNLRHLELALIRGLSDLNVIAECTQLQWLHLESLRQVIALPDLSRLTALRQVVLQNMKGLTDLACLCTAPALEDLHVYESSHLRPEQLICLRTHPSLKRLSPSLGTDRKNDAVVELLHLSPADSPDSFHFRA